MKRVLVFGASGFTGRHLDLFAHSRGLHREYEFIAADLRKPETGFQAFTEIRQVDARDGMAVSRLIGDSSPELIVSLAGVFRADSYQEYIEANVETSRHILDACGSPGLRIRKVLLIGSAAEYGVPASNPVSEQSQLQPVNYYGLSKAFQTILARHYFAARGIPAVVARTFNISGRGISPALAIGHFNAQISAARSGDTIRVGNLSSERDFLPIEEVVSSYWTLLVHAVPGEVYNVCSGRPTRIGEILRQMILESGKRIEAVESADLMRPNDVPCIYGSRNKLDRLIAGIQQLGRTPE